MIGMSLYPYWASKDNDRSAWLEVADNCVANINHLKEKYNKPIMLCEIGMHWDKGEECKALIEHMMNADIEGVFYWEPGSCKLQRRLPARMPWTTTLYRSPNGFQELISINITFERRGNWLRRRSLS